MSHLGDLTFYLTSEHDCSYLDSQQSTTIFVDPEAKIDQKAYSELSELGFRRSGTHFYRPHCNNCKACIPIRIPVQLFEKSRSQKRIWNKCRALNAQKRAACFHEDHYLIYEKYINLRHADGDMYPPSREQYRSFLVDSPMQTQFIEFSLGAHVVGVSVMDTLKDGLSAIYTFFDPEYEALSLGSYAILWQLQEAKTLDLPYVYLGYFIRQCQKMHYKNKFKPFEARINDIWIDSIQLEAIANTYAETP